MKKLFVCLAGATIAAAAPAAAEDGTAQVDLSDALSRLLVQLPPRQRAVIVAR